MFVTLVVFFLILTVLVLVHELGHFLTAKILGIKVEEFGFGLPPRIFGRKIGETIYSLNWLPIGGFVRLYGEEGPEGKSRGKSRDTKRAFYSRPMFQRTLVIIAGVVMNFTLATVIISYLFTRGVMVPTNRVHIEKIIENSPAQVSGLKEKDVILKIKCQESISGEMEGSNAKCNDTDIKNGDQLSQTTRKYLGQEIILEIERNGELIEIPIVPRKDFPPDQGPMGVVISNYEKRIYSIWQAPILGLKESLMLSWELTKGIGITLWKLISFQAVSKDVAGPIGIAQMTGEAVKFGWDAVIQMMGLLSLNLAIVNILPFPALDGGRLLFIFIEKATGRRVKTHVERYIHQAGMIILLALVVLVTVNDLIRIFGK